MRAPELWLYSAHDVCICFYMPSIFDLHSTHNIDRNGDYLFRIMTNVRHVPRFMQLRCSDCRRLFNHLSRCDQSTWATINLRAGFHGGNLMASDGLCLMPGQLEQCGDGGESRTGCRLCAVLLAIILANFGIFCILKLQAKSQFWVC